MGPRLIRFYLKFSGALLVKLTHNQFSRLLESYHHIRIYSVLNDLHMLGFFSQISTPDFHGDLCSFLFILPFTVPVVMHFIDGFLESSETQQFYNCIINNSINCSSPHLLLIYEWIFFPGSIFWSPSHIDTCIYTWGRNVISFAILVPKLPLTSVRALPEECLIAACRSWSYFCAPGTGWSECTQVGSGVPRTLEPRGVWGEAWKCGFMCTRRRRWSSRGKPGKVTEDSVTQEQGKLKILHDQHALNFTCLWVCFVLF